jgi:anti-sigma factor RsiW
MRDQLSEYLDGTLGERDRERMEPHLAGCPGCRGFANTLEATITAVRELPREHLPDAAPARLQQLAHAPNLSQRERAVLGPLGLLGTQR